MNRMLQKRFSVKHTIQLIGVVLILHLGCNLLGWIVSSTHFVHRHLILSLVTSSLSPYYFRCRRRCSFRRFFRSSSWFRSYFCHVIFFVGGFKLTIIPVLTAIPRPQYVFGTMSPKPTLKNVIAISLYMAKDKMETHGGKFGNQLIWNWFCKLCVKKKIGILFGFWFCSSKLKAMAQAMAITYHIELSRLACSSSWNLFFSNDHRQSTRTDGDLARITKIDVKNGK